MILTGRGTLSSRAANLHLSVLCAIRLCDACNSRIVKHNAAQSKDGSSHSHIDKMVNYSVGEKNCK